LYRKKYVQSHDHPDDAQRTIITTAPWVLPQHTQNDLVSVNTTFTPSLSSSVLNSDKTLKLALYNAGGSQKKMVSAMIFNLK